MQRKKGYNKIFINKTDWSVRSMGCNMKLMVAQSFINNCNVFADFIPNMNSSCPLWHTNVMYCTRRLLSFQWDESKPQKRQSHRRGKNIEKTKQSIGMEKKWNRRDWDRRRKKKHQINEGKESHRTSHIAHITLVGLVFVAIFWWRSSWVWCVVAAINRVKSLLFLFLLFTFYESHFRCTSSGARTNRYS